MKKLKKLTLKKEIITKLESDDMSNLKGGTGGTTSTVCGNPTTETIGGCFPTKGDCDLHTIGHDDGPNCLSKTDWGWCWCYGVG